MFRQHVLVVLLGIVVLSQAVQIPKAYVPGKSVTYPENYCKSIKNNEEFDFVVIGSGPGGSTVARRLAENPMIKVLIIEAGGDPPKRSDLPGNRLQIRLDNLKKEMRWNWQTIPETIGCARDENKICRYNYARVLGGSSVINGMMAPRGNPKDFDEWEKLGNKGWGYKNVLPYFKKLENFHGPPMRNRTVSQKIQRFQESLAGDETNDIDRNYHGTDGPLSISSFPIDPRSHELRQALFEAFKELKLPINEDVNGKTQTGFTNLPGIIDTLGYRDSIVKAYLQDLPKNLKVCKNATVWKLNVENASSCNKKIESVLFEFHDMFYNVTAKKEYILSAGGFGSPQILERSGIGNPKILENAGVTVKHELPGVGENLQDHFINGASTFIVNLKNEASQNPLSLGITSLTGFLNLTDYSEIVPDVQCFLALQELTISSSNSSEQDKKTKFSEEQTQILFSFSAVVLRQQIPGSVHITQATDLNLTPIIEPNYYKGKRDLQFTIAGTRLIRKIMLHPAFKKFKPQLMTADQCKHFKENSDEEIICQVNYSSGTLHHTVGTSAMGPDPEKDVVNYELKVHGIQNLRIIDSSIMPLVVRSNTEIPTVMIAEKGADMVKAQWK